jgi:hypothetical protein
LNYLPRRGARGRSELGAACDEEVDAADGKQENERECRRRMNAFTARRAEQNSLNRFERAEQAGANRAPGDDRSARSLLTCVDPSAARGLRKVGGLDG